MSSKYLFLVGSQISSQEKEKMATLEQANAIDFEMEEDFSMQKTMHEKDSHLCIQGKLYICLDAIMGKTNCSFCVVNSFNKLMHTRIDGQQNLHMSFRSTNENSSASQNINNLLSNLSTSGCAQQQAIHSMISQLLQKKIPKDYMEEESSPLSMSTNASLPKSFNLSHIKSPYLCMSWDNNESCNSSISVQISSQFLQILDWSPEDLQLETHSMGLLEMTTGFNLNEPLMWLLGQFCTNNTNELGFQSESPLFPQQFLNSKNQIVNALVSYEIVNTPEKFYLIICIKQVESTLGKRYPTRHTKESSKMNVQLQTSQNISMYFTQSSSIKLDNLISQSNRVLSNEEIMFIEKYHDPNITQSHPELVRFNQQQCKYRYI